jgi:hypothetical protein
VLFIGKILRQVGHHNSDSHKMPSQIKIGQTEECAACEEGENRDLQHPRQEIVLRAIWKSLCDPDYPAKLPPHGEQ